MIMTNFQEYKSSELPEDIKEAITKALVFVDKNKNINDGTYPLLTKMGKEENKLIIMRYTTKKEEEAFYETHDEMTDVQILLEGEEYMYIRQSYDLTPTNSGEDIQFYAEKPNDYTRVHITPHTFCVIFPKEAHAPSICVNEPSNVLKMVLKLKR